MTLYDLFMKYVIYRMRISGIIYVIIYYDMNINSKIIKFNLFNPKLGSFKQIELNANDEIKIKPGVIYVVNNDTECELLLLSNKIISGIGLTKNWMTDS